MIARLKARAHKAKHEAKHEAKAPPQAKHKAKLEVKHEVKAPPQAEQPAAPTRDDENAALKAEINRLRGVLKFHLGRDDL